MTDQKKLFKSIRDRLAQLVDKEAAQIKDDETRRLFKASIMGSAHLEPGTHEPEQVGVPEHMEPGTHEMTDLGSEAPPAGEAQPVSGGLGLPGDVVNGGGDENGTVDLCPLCGQEDTPDTCTCLSQSVAKNDTLGGGETGIPASGPGLMNAPLVRSEPCKKCGEMHGNLMKCGETKPGVSAVKKSVEGPASIPDPKNKGLPKDKPGKEIKNPGNGGKAANKPKDNSAGLKKGWPKDDAENKANAAGFNIHNQLPEPTLMTHAPAGISRELRQKGAGLPIPTPKIGAGPHDPLSLPETSNQGGPRDLASEQKFWAGRGPVKKADVPAAKPPSGKVPGGTSAPPMANNTSAPKIGAKAPTPAAPKPPAGLGKAALPPNKDQMRQHALSDASRAAAKNPPAPGPQMSAPKLTNPNDMGRANALAAQMPGPSFQPQAAPKLGLKPPPAPAAGAPKRSLFSALFGGKPPKSA